MAASRNLDADEMDVQTSESQSLTEPAKAIADLTIILSAVKNGKVGAGLVIRACVVLLSGRSSRSSGVARNVNWGRGASPFLPPPSPPLSLPLLTGAWGYNPRNFLEIKGARR